jgi:mRNA-degrading endonuclease RelE of RelBE toxin-antitoxin system
VAYVVEIKKRAEKDIENLPEDQRRRVRDAIDGLEQNPRPSASRS